MGSFESCEKEVKVEWDNMKPAAVFKKAGFSVEGGDHSGKSGYKAGKPAPADKSPADATASKPPPECAAPQEAPVRSISTKDVYKKYEPNREPPPGHLEIDGSFGEGGGQVLRNTFAYSAVL